MKRYLKHDAVDAVQFANESIGRDLKMKREAAGLTQAEVAKTAKVRPEMIPRLESGLGNPTVATVNKILRAISRG